MRFVYHYHYYFIYINILFLTQITALLYVLHSNVSSLDLFLECFSGWLGINATEMLLIAILWHEISMKFVFFTLPVLKMEALFYAVMLYKTIEH